MGKNVIISEQTVRDLLEAHASLSAWYYELWSAIRAGTEPRPPDDAARSAFVERLAADFPEIASVVRSISVPRMFVPPPPSYAVPPPVVDSPGAEPAAAPPPAIAEPPAGAAAPPPAEESTSPAQSPPPADAAATPAVAPPPFVVPSQVKYDS
jgi:hypothetical protein